MAVGTEFAWLTMLTRFPLAAGHRFTHMALSREVCFIINGLRDVEEFTFSTALFKSIYCHFITTLKPIYVLVLG
jgi:hypothetical protein